MKVLAVAVSVACMAILLPACGGDDSSSSSSDQAGSTSTSAEKPSKTLNVRVITVTPTNLGTWDPSNRKGYDAVAEEFGWNLEIAEAVTYGKAPAVLDEWGSAGVDLVISTDNGFEPSLVKAAEKYPDTKWIIMSDLLTKKQLPNIAGYTGDWCQIGFAEGVAGGLISKAHKMGYSAAVPIPPALKAFEGMKIGAKATGTGTTVAMKASGDFLDAAKSSETTSALMDDGADVISAIVHGVNGAIAARIQSAGNYYIGSYDDESKFAPKAVPTNATFEFQIAYAQVGKELEAGSFDPGPHTYGIKDGYIKLTPFKLGFENQYDKAQAIMKDAADGKYDADFEACNQLEQ
ncbi:MAG: basic rane protein [Thermoleophilaceae bacterium]|jgi:basic membrane lipoprotein Med (substrate-binding protein (PBP1-ABC) superfamily)|nr:basic rane protein [Thermoleophilaceae bacterium]